MGAIANKEVLIDVLQADVVIISGSVHADSQQRALVTGPCESCEFKGIGRGKPLETKVFSTTAGGYLTVKFDTAKDSRVRSSEHIMELDRHSVLKTIVLATDEQAGSNPDQDFNDMILTIQIMRQKG